MKTLFVSPHRLHVLANVKSVLHLPFWGRLLHHKSHRTIGMMGLGITIMMTGSWIASEREAISHVVGLHHLIFDSLGYFLHAAGAIPALRYVEPFWALLSGTAIAAE